MFLEGDKMQVAAALRVGLPGLPGSQEVEAESKAGFKDDEAILALPALRQLVAVKKDMARLRRATVGRVIDVVEACGVRLADRIEFKAGGLEFFH